MMDNERRVLESDAENEDRQKSPPVKIEDINMYQHKKTLAEGLLNLALLLANANQLRYVIETGSSHHYYYPSLSLIGIGLIFQIAVGILLLVNVGYNIKNRERLYKANRINNYTIIGIFFITIINVLISAFSIANTQHLKR